MKRYLPFVIIVAVAVGAVGGGSYFYRKKLAELTRTYSPSVAPQNLVGDQTAHLRGDADAKVTLEEFGDFQCPPCGIFASTLLRIEHDYGAKLRVIFRQYPLAVHVHALEAARAAEAAGLQGRFWEMHDLLFKNQMTWTVAPNVTETFKEYASGIGLDLDRFARDYESEAVKERIETDRKGADARGVTSTPTVFINGKMVPPPSLAEASLRTILDAALRGQPFLPTPTPTPAP